MIVPVKNIVEQVDLTSDDVLLPLLECVVNSIIGIQQLPVETKDRKIQIQISRGQLPQSPTFENLKTISSFKIIDTGVGFNSNNFKSFETPFSQINKDYGCKGIGRFTVLAAYRDYLVDSNYFENGKWYKRSFKFSTDKEIEVIEFNETDVEENKTIVEISNCFNPILLEKSALSILEIAEAIMHHCLIYYLNETLPLIEIIDTENSTGEVINQLFEKVSKEKERDFKVKENAFKLYITKTPKEGNRKNNYLFYCANSRAVGNGRNLKNVNSLFTYPVLINGDYFFFDIYLVSEFLNVKVFKTRNGFNIPKERENLLFNTNDAVTFQDVEENVSQILEKEYESFVKDAKEKSLKEVVTYISDKAPRYNSFLKNENILKAIPPNLSEDKLEEHLYKVSFNARKNVEQNIEKFIKNKSVNEEAINQIIADIKEKTAYDVDSLADYMTRRKAIIDLFDKFLNADENGEYKLEEDVHNLIFPLGLTNNCKLPRKLAIRS